MFEGNNLSFGEPNLLMPPSIPKFLLNMYEPWILQPVESPSTIVPDSSRLTGMLTADTPTENPSAFAAVAANNSEKRSDFKDLKSR
jgi:hypothetical protein